MTQEAPAQTVDISIARAWETTSQQLAAENTTLKATNTYLNTQLQLTQQKVAAFEAAKAASDQPKTDVVPIATAQQEKAAIEDGMAKAEQLAEALKDKARAAEKGK